MKRQFLKQVAQHLSAFLYSVLVCMMVLLLVVVLLATLPFEGLGLTGDQPASMPM